MRFVGLNLTVPHKLLAVGMVDVLDESASTWGAVNTIRFEAQDANGHWLPLVQAAEETGPIRSHGFNTDAEAIARALREDVGVEPRGARVLLLGAGGAGRVAALKLASDGVAELALVNRTPEKAEAVAAEIRQRFPRCGVSVGYPAGAVDLLMNATSMGLRTTDSSPLEDTGFDLRCAAAVYDMIYQPAETALLKAAKAAGCRTANGLGMLLYQGARALEIWTGQPAPLDLMRRALARHVYGH
jgi:shikimate dehydrogenase